MFIYKFTHLESNRSYIGQTIQDPNRRRLEHICDSRDSNKTYHFHNALKKYGVNAFSFEVIDEAKTIEELNSLEESYIQKFNSIDNGFNIRNGGGNKTHNPESIERMSQAQKNAHAKRKAEGRATIPWNKGKTGYTQKEHSVESKKQRSLRVYGSGNPMYGTTWKLIDGKRVYSRKIQ
jgi:group I intron endonuclease